MTLEPCCHHGKTPPCTDAILAAGIARVVAAVGDPFPQVDGGGLAALAAAGLRVEVGCEADAARELNAPYWKRLTTGRPYVTAKWAMTLDGKTAVAGGDSRWISSEDSRRLVHELRGRMDAILVGIGTVEADDPRLTVRPPGPRRPVPDRAGQLGPDRDRIPRWSGPPRRSRSSSSRPTGPRSIAANGSPPPAARSSCCPGAAPSRSASCSTSWDAAG